MRYYYESVHAGFYRSRDGFIAGVCQGIADYFDVSVFWTRTLIVLMAIISGIWPALFVYAFAALLMKKEPYVRWEP